MRKIQQRVNNPTESLEERVEKRNGFPVIGDRLFAAMIAVLATALVFSPFFGQWVNAGFVSFRYTSDQLRLAFPSFHQAWKLLQHNGIDINSFNGATEMVFRSNLSLQYPFFILFSLLGTVIGFKAAYFLFYASHMAVFIYFGILLVTDVFQQERKYACLFSLSALSILVYSIWYSPFYTIAALTTPMLFFALKLHRKFTATGCILCVFTYVCGFLSGYATVSVFECGMVLLLSLLFGLLWREDPLSEKKVKSVIVKTFAPFVLSACVVGPYLLQVFWYTSDVVSPTTDLASTSFSQAVSYPLVPKDWVTILSNAFYPLNVIETTSLCHLGWPWCAALLIAVLFRDNTRLLNRKKRIWLGVIAAMAFCLLLVAAGTSSSFAYWFYAIPVLGGMHLPIRYFVVVMPVFILACVLFISGQKPDAREKTALWIAAVLTAVAIALEMFTRTYSAQVDENILLVELVILLIFFLLYIKQDLSWPAVMFVILGCTAFPLIQNLYSDIRIEKSAYESYSLVYSEDASAALNNFVGELPEQERYKFLTIDEAGYLQLPEYVPNNVAMYEMTDYTLTEYLGYELQLATPHDYLSRMPWFNNIDWGYVADTRGDFVVATASSMEAQAEKLQTMIDWESPALTFPNDVSVYRLNKFIPRYYTGGEVVKDDGSCLDNGYFYCPDLSNENIVSFETNKANRFIITLDTPSAKELAFTLYPNRYYHYYVDGQEIEPILYDMQVFIPVQAGEHQVSVLYKNPFNVFSNTLLCTFYAVVCAGLVWQAAVYFRRRKQKLVSKTEGGEK